MPIHSFPNELLIKIFVTGCDIDEDHEWSIRRKSVVDGRTEFLKASDATWIQHKPRLFTDVLANVCRHWQAVISSEASCWVIHVTLDCAHPQLVQDPNRSKFSSRLLLDKYPTEDIYLYVTGANTNDPPSMRINLLRIMALIGDYKARWRGARFRADSTDFGVLFEHLRQRSSVPNLRFLDIEHSKHKN